MTNKCVNNKDYKEATSSKLTKEMVKLTENKATPEGVINSLIKGKTGRLISNVGIITPAISFEKDEKRYNPEETKRKLSEM